MDIKYFARFHTLDGLTSKLYSFERGSVAIYMHRACRPSMVGFTDGELPDNITVHSRRYYLKEKKQLNKRVICEYHEDTRQ